MSALTDTQILATAVASVATAEGVALYVGFLAGRRDAIAASWAAGTGWLAAHRVAVPRTGVHTRLAAAEVWVLALVLRPHGQHRRQVTT
jgi:hypothetical protein